MRAVVFNSYGGPEVLQITQVDIPKPKGNQVLIQVKAFGINRAELYMRHGVWGDVAPISGIECVGQVVHDPRGQLPAGQTVATFMGGLARSMNGCYAEYVAAPADHVYPLSTRLSWEELATLPQSYATAWYCLRHNLNLSTKQSLLIRGATSALGQAALHLARHQGATVIASTRDRAKAKRLTQQGATHIVIDDGQLSPQLRSLYANGVDAVLDLVGNHSLIDSLRSCRPGGYVCQAGFLGGPAPIAFNPITDLPSRVNLNFFASFSLGLADFPPSVIPLQQLVQQAEQGHYPTEPGHVFPLEQIRDAHRLMASNQSQGKIVITLDPA